MKCRTCGGTSKPAITDLPFKLGPASIAIVKDLPVLQCGQCGEFILEDEVMRRVDERLKLIDPSTELEIIRYAA